MGMKNVVIGDHGIMGSYSMQIKNLRLNCLVSYLIALV